MNRAVTHLRAITAGPPGPAVRVVPARRARWSLLAVVLALAACQGSRDHGTPADRSAGAVPRARVSAREIPLRFELDPQRLQFSSLEWWGDRLVFVPQHPEFFAPEDSCAWFALDRDSIARYLDGTDPGPLPPYRIAFDDAGVIARVEGFDGFEALAVNGDRAVVAIERVKDGQWGSVMMMATLRERPLRIRLLPTEWLELVGRSGTPGFSDETLVTAGESVWSLHELNGRSVNPQPKVQRFGFDLGPLASVPMTNVEYRITDATTADADGRFWVTNQYWPPESELVVPSADPLADVDRPAGTPVERLVALRMTADGVVLDRDEGVIEIELGDDRVARNWEGIVRWDETGFLVVTDEHPRTIFAFVPRR